MTGEAAAAAPIVFKLARLGRQELLTRATLAVDYREPSMAAALPAMTNEQLVNLLIERGAGR